MDFVFGIRSTGPILRTVATLTLVAGSTFLAGCWYCADCDEGCWNGTIPGTNICASGAEYSCEDYLDDDADGYTDCADVECGSDWACADLPPEECGNLVDDDGDGFIDCADNECTPGWNDYFAPDPACTYDTCPVDTVRYCDDEPYLEDLCYASPSSCACGCVDEALIDFELRLSASLGAAPCAEGCTVRLTIHAGTPEEEAIDLARVASPGPISFTCESENASTLGCGVFVDLAAGEIVALELVVTSLGTSIFDCEQTFDPSERPSLHCQSLVTGAYAQVDFDPVRATLIPPPVP